MISPNKKFSIAGFHIYHLGLVLLLAAPGLTIMGQSRTAPPKPVPPPQMPQRIPPIQPIRPPASINVPPRPINNNASIPRAPERPSSRAPGRTAEAAKPVRTESEFRSGAGGPSFAPPSSDGGGEESESAMPTPLPAPTAQISLEPSPTNATTSSAMDTPSPSATEVPSPSLSASRRRVRVLLQGGGRGWRWALSRYSWWV